MIERLLVANRGEIAVRIIRAARDLGIDSVAVYGPADRLALHVRLADSAVALPTDRSYLDVASILTAARAAGATAVHPGYGFLSENPALAQACTDSGLVFIGPSATAIRTMGDKSQARRLVAELGIPVVRGTEVIGGDHVPSLPSLAIRTPFFVKAAAGGGGRGMRLVRNPAEFETQLAAARREARGAFGDDRVYLEEAVSPARHVEIQLLADVRGSIATLGERDCSIQRRAQKVIEESPSPVVDDQLRDGMSNAAVRIAVAVAYVGAGTVEFLVDSEGGFHFIEMNTRVQVEHGVTEMATGVDIVAAQLVLAAGEPLPMAPGPLPVHGHTIEFRLVAENPLSGYRPSPGTISCARFPSGPWVRVDTAVEDGVVVSPLFDSLLAKIIVWGRDRHQAIERSRRALREVTIEGVYTNLHDLAMVIDDPTFVGGAYHTEWLETTLSQRIEKGPTAIDGGVPDLLQEL